LRLLGSRGHRFAVSIFAHGPRRKWAGAGRYIEESWQYLSRGDAETFDGFTFQLHTLKGMQVSALNQNLKGRAYFVAHVFAD